MTKPVVLFGTGPLARVVHFLLTNESPRQVVAFTVDREHQQEDTLAGLPVVPFEEVHRRYPPDDFGMFVAVGYRRVNRFRAERYATARAMGYELITHVSPRASTWPGLVIGDNCLVMDQVVIYPFARIGSDCILWSGSHVGHESVIGDHCFISSHAVVSGLATIEERCFIGTNATIRDGITVARECVVGAGVVIAQNTKERGVYAAPRATLLAATSDQLPNL